MDWDTAARLLRGRRLPAAVVDLAALEHNVERLRRWLAGSGKTLRVASKSVRHVGLLRRILARGGHDFAGLMTFSAEETELLAEEGFDDLLLAYPTTQVPLLQPLARRVAAGAVIRFVIDCPAHLSALDRAGRAAGCRLEAVVELDVSWRHAAGRLHLGARRSPLRTPEAVLELALAASDSPDTRVVGLMGYEAQIAGVPDRPPARPALAPAVRALKRLSTPAVRKLRARTVEQLRGAGVELALVNGGGTGSLASTVRDDSVTEVTAGTGFLCPHLFDHYRGLDLTPAAFFALEVCRAPDPGLVTCAGGGYVASGQAGDDRLPLPWLPPGLSLLPMEGAGEVQTPLRVPAGGPRPVVGDPVLFRHAKAGELAERFPSYLLVRDGRVEAEEPTYRGQGCCFF